MSLEQKSHHGEERLERGEQRIQTLFQRFNGGTISTDEYLESLKHQTGL